MKKSFPVIATILFLTTSAAASAQQELSLDEGALAEAVAAKQQSNVYIVQMQGDPIVAYEGGIKGYKATKPGKGKKVDPNSAHFKKYAGHLNAQHDEALTAIGGAQKIYDYTVVFNGFAAVLTPSQIQALKARDDVLEVWQDELLKPTTNSTPDFLGLTAGGEPWSKGNVGEDVIIGMIDTGVQPDHPSLADVPTPKKGNKGKLIPYGPAPAGWVGEGCDFGNVAFNPLDAAFTCNNKLLKAEFFSDSFLSFNTLAAGEFLSARDSDGHGSHTTTTAGGNNGVSAEIDGIPVGSVSGMAPRARIATYKVCWDAPDPNDSGCFSSDSMAAIDTAVEDGVDVINFSIGGSSTNFNGPDDIAFLFAADAGVFVSVSAGNSGPGAQTIGTPSGVPWVTSVGAVEDDENFGTGLVVSAPVSIADTYEGLEGDSPVQLTDTGTIIASVVPAVPLDGCAALTNPGDIAGNIALAIRGTCSFNTKYNNAAAAGAQAIVVYNDGTSASRVDPIVMTAPGTIIPGIMIGFFDGDLINTTAAGGDTVAGTLGPDILVPRVNRITGFSSRGPNGGAADIIKPDVAAPGVGIIAGETLFPNANAGGGQFFQFLSGTSMSSPHVAGTFALLKQAHPDWTAAMARSALMTTARQDLSKTFGDTAADPFDIGAGHIVPSDAFNPGLVYDADLFDYVRFTCGSETQPQIFTQGTCDFFGSIDSSDLNLPSIGIGELAGSQTITRTVSRVTNRGSKRFTAHVTPPRGVEVTVQPSELRLKRGESASYEVTFSVTDAAVLDEFAFGSLTWSNSKFDVRSPIAVRPVALAAPAEVSAAGTAGSLNFDVLFGYTGDYVPTMDGLAAAAAIGNAVADGGFNFEFFVVPDGTTLARFSLFDEDVGAGDGSDDLDLQVFGPDVDGFPFVGSSGTPTSEEEVNLVNPAPGVYAVAVIDFASAPGPTPYTLFDFNLDGSDAGNSVITAPLGAVLGATQTVTVNWAGLTAGTRALGIISHSDGVDTLGQTEVSINTQ